MLESPNVGIQSTALRALEWLLLIVALAYLCGSTLPRAWNAVSTDFPNYYIAAHMLRNGENVERIYEWTEIQRQKNRLEINQPVVGFIPLTPVSALPIVPLANLSPLAAKRSWIVINLVLMIIVVALLRSITGLEWRRLALLAAIMLPLHHNLVLGQAYILLLTLLTVALWFYLHKHTFAGGLCIALGFGLKIFPVLFFLFFLRKRDWRALAGLLIGSCAIVLLSIKLFGLELNRTYLLQVLPWALRGEALDPYNLHASSISAVLHHLFVYEPEWNPHPAFPAPTLLAVLHPLIQVLIIGPVLLLISAYSEESKRTQCEWGIFVTALLTISTAPAFYDFTILLLPGALILALLMRAQRWTALAIFSVLYFAICWPFKLEALPRAIVPRLYLLVLLCAFGCLLLNEGVSRLAVAANRRTWISAFALGLAVAITVNIDHQRGVYDTYRWRLPTPGGIFAASHPVALPNEILFTAMLQVGYRSAELTSHGVRLSTSSIDQLTQTADPAERWTEHAGAHSTIVATPTLDGQTRIEVDNAASPVVSPNGSWLAFLRYEAASARLWLKSMSDGTETAITQSGLNVMEVTFLPDDALVFSATRGGAPHLYLRDRFGSIRLLLNEEARYPAVSPDGQWLAFSRLQHGTWNLYLQDLSTGRIEAITDVRCNNISPAWADAKTLVYASDCGRGLWLTALCRRRVLP